MNTESHLNEPSRSTRANWIAHVFTGLLLTAIAVLGVLLAIASRQARPLERELAQLRAEAGYLDIHDRSKVYAVRIRSDTPDEWAWRIYLPDDQTYTLYNYRGRLPDPGDPVDLDSTRHSRAGSGSYGGIDSGEFVLRFRIEEDADGKLFTRVVSRSGGGTVGAKPRSTWFADRDWEETSAIPAEGQREIPADATFDLIRLRQESDVDPNDPERRAETIALWIAPEKATE